MFIFIISIVVWFVSDSILFALVSFSFMIFLKVCFKLIDALLSNKETGGILTLIGLAWLLDDGAEISDTILDQDIESEK